MERNTISLRLVSSLAGLIIACCPLFAHAAPMTGDRYAVNFSGTMRLVEGLSTSIVPSLRYSHAEAGFALGNQLADGNFLIEDFRMSVVGPRWSPADMLQGFYNPQVNRLVACLDSGCTKYSVTVSQSEMGIIGFRNNNELFVDFTSSIFFGGAGAYDVNPVPTNGTYTVAINLDCVSQRFCDPTFGSINGTFALGSQLTGGNYEIERLTVEFGLSFFPSDILQGFYNPQFNQLVACLDSGCTQYSVTIGRSQFGEFGFRNNNQWTIDSTTLASRNGFAYGTYAITPVAIPEPSTYAMIMAGLGLLGIVARRRKQQAAV